MTRFFWLFLTLASAPAGAAAPAVLTAPQQDFVQAQARAFTGRPCQEALNYRAVRVGGLVAGMLGGTLHDQTLKELKKQGGTVLRDEQDSKTKAFRLLSRKNDREVFIAFVPEAGAYAVLGCRVK